MNSTGIQLASKLQKQIILSSVVMLSIGGGMFTAITLQPTLAETCLGGGFGTSLRNV
ncbi:hypothetical protein K0U27_10260 [archaeon]|nr:hypothetical protein [archaeon]